MLRELGGDTESPMQVCLLSRSSESTHFLCLMRGVALLDSTRAPDDFGEPKLVPWFHFLAILNRFRQHIIRKQRITYLTANYLSNTVIAGLSWPHINIRLWFGVSFQLRMLRHATYQYRVQYALSVTAARIIIIYPLRNSTGFYATGGRNQAFRLV